MTTVGIRMMKTHLSQYLKLVKEGQTISVTERGKQIATIVPFSQEKEKVHLMNLVREGKVSWGGGKPKFPKKLIHVKGKPLSQMIIEDRG